MLYALTSRLPTVLSLSVSRYTRLVVPPPCTLTALVLISPRHPSWLSLSVLHVSLDGATLTRPKLAKHPLFWSSPNARPYQCSRSGSPPQTSGFKNDNSWQVGFDLQFIKYLLCVYPCNTVIICTNFWYPMNSCQICCRRGNFILICLK